MGTGAAGDFVSKSGPMPDVTGAEIDGTDEAAPPSREPGSMEESAEAAEEESVSQDAVTAPARRSGRSRRHGERIFAMRTTPSTYR